MLNDSGEFFLSVAVVGMIDGYVDDSFFGVVVVIDYFRLLGEELDEGDVFFSW